MSLRDKLTAAFEEYWSDQGYGEDRDWAEDNTTTALTVFRDVLRRDAIRAAIESVPAEWDPANPEFGMHLMLDAEPWASVLDRFVDAVLTVCEDGTPKDE